jgi:hypothetical protein
MRWQRYLGVLLAQSPPPRDQWQSLLACESVAQCHDRGGDGSGPENARLTRHTVGLQTTNKSKLSVRYSDTNSQYRLQHSISSDVTFQRT